MEDIQQMEEADQDDIMPVIDTESFADDNETTRPQRHITGRGGSSWKRTTGSGGLRAARAVAGIAFKRNHSAGLRDESAGKASSAVNRFKQRRLHPYRSARGGGFGYGRQHSHKEQRSIPSYHDLDNPEDEEDYANGEDDYMGYSGRNCSPGDARCVVKFSNLDSSVKDADIKALCSRHGKTISCRVIYDPETGRHTGQAVVEFDRAQDASRAVTAYADLSLDGRPLSCSLAGDEQTGGTKVEHDVFARLTSTTGSLSLADTYGGPRNGGGGWSHDGRGSPKQRDYYASKTHSYEKESFSNRTNKPQYPNREAVSSADLDEELENYMKDSSN